MVVERVASTDITEILVEPCGGSDLGSGSWNDRESRIKNPGALGDQNKNNDESQGGSK